jgi:hypothetical protein
MKNVLNVIADILTLMALCVAAIGHVLPWFESGQFQRGAQAAKVDMAELHDLQRTYASQSGPALGALGALICLSLIFRWGPTMRRALNLGMFAAAFAALLFELMIFSQSSGREIPFYNMAPGFFLAMVPTCFALFFCLVRMLWTMPPSAPVVPTELDKRPRHELHSKEAGFTEHRG